MNSKDKKLLKLKTELNIIEKQNGIEDEDIAWNKSLTKKLVLAVSLYIVIGLFLHFRNFPSAWIDALVPSLGFIIGSYIIEIVKKYWQEKIYK